MKQKFPPKFLKELESAVGYEERLTLYYLHECYKRLPGKLNLKEVEQIRPLLDLLLVQSINHANILSEILIKFYERSSRKI